MIWLVIAVVAFFVGLRLGRADRQYSQHVRGFYEGFGLGFTRGRSKGFDEGFWTALEDKEGVR